MAAEMWTILFTVLWNFSFPLWRGPPTMSTYYAQGSGNISQKVPAVSRLKYASNNKDIILSDVRQSDFGEYKCTYPLLGYYKTVLEEKSSSSTTSTSATAVTLTCLIYQLLQNLEQLDLQ